MKMWVTNGGEADIYLVMARTMPGRGAAGISCFVVVKGTPGLSFGKTERKMGLHSSPTRELIFSDCVIPEAQRLGNEGQDFKIALVASTTVVNESEGAMKHLWRKRPYLRLSPS